MAKLHPGVKFLQPVTFPERTVTLKNLMARHVAIRQCAVSMDLRKLQFEKEMERSMNRQAENKLSEN